jgi:hypothetical protein
MNLSGEEKGWIKKRITEFYAPEYENEKQDFRKRAIDRRMRWILGYIEKEKPSDVKAFVEKYLKRKGYIREVESIEHEIEDMESFDEITYSKIKKEFDTLVKEIKSDDPEFWEERKKRIMHTGFLLGAKLAGIHERAEE